MRAVRRTEAGIEVVERATPGGIAGAGVGVRVRSCGICQTDINLARMGPLPFGLGHEIAGELLDGTPVGIEPTVPCGTCRFCRTNDTMYCERGYQMLLGIGMDGGMTDEIVVPERCIVPLPRGLDAADACLIEPLAIHLHSLDMARFQGTQRVCVVGANLTGFGLLAVAAARFRGAEVDMVDPRDHVLAAAERLGAGTKARGDYDLVLECDGSEEMIGTAVEHCRPGGTVLLVAGYYADKTMPTTACVTKELTMIWGTYYGHSATARDVDAAAAILARRPEIAKTVITHRFPLEGAPEAFALVESAAESLKVVLEP